MLLLWAVMPVVATAQGVFERPLNIGLLLPREAALEPVEGKRPETAAQAALLGGLMVRDELRHNASLLGIDVDVIIAAIGEEGPAEAARRLLQDEGVIGLVGGFGPEHALELARFADEHAVPFLNIGTPHDRLRNEECGDYLFHVEPSDAMYLDAITGWFVRAGFRRWAFVHDDDERGKALYQRAAWALESRHFAGREAARVALPAPAEDVAWGEVVARLKRGRPDVVLLLLGPARQLEFLEASATAGEEWEVAGFPYPDAQTRAFYAAWARAGAHDEDLYRASAWEATLDAYGAREFNERFAARWGTPMDASAWAAYQAVRIIYDSAIATRSLDGPRLAAHMADPNSVFDVWKGIGVSFRPWDQQLRQSLYLVLLASSGDAEPEVTLVGELPALYLPRTDPVERLDQLGDLAERSRCTSNR